MSSLCCCCFSSENSGEVQPLLQPKPSELSVGESARQTRPARSDAPTVTRRGRLAMRRVGVSGLDQRFSDVAEVFNRQQEHYEAMLQHIAKLVQSYACTCDDTLTVAEVLGKIKEEHGAEYRISLQRKGCGFYLCAVPLRAELEIQEKQLPPRLLLAQEELKGAYENAKATMSEGTKINLLTGWLLSGDELMAEQVKGGAGSYQEQQRLDDNLKDNMKETRRAKEMSVLYKKRAGDVLSEAEQIAGTNL
ncbi:uncharacterized protein si:ch73-345f18.3 [Thalassophryne amazonica]|uniref:uncharacterized protein si:ch73-345f18.3 n=1 Tax=Thalassophryne amazonica TaxID=390379 RepID=UPI001470AB98|nr:uncharacterized protein si:ch73-345f18.3 [Thalassophryne amazonica]